MAMATKVLNLETHTILHPKTLERLHWLADRDIVISVCYGPSEGLGVIWTANCMTFHGQEFARAQRAVSFDQAVEIAVRHAVKLGFAEGPVP
jgi:hypothetical protein